MARRGCASRKAGRARASASSRSVRPNGTTLPAVVPAMWDGASTMPTSGCHRAAEAGRVPATQRTYGAPPWKIAVLHILHEGSIGKPRNAVMVRQRGVAPRLSWAQGGLARAIQSARAPPPASAVLTARTSACQPWPRGLLTGGPLPRRQRLTAPRRPPPPSWRGTAGTYSRPRGSDRQ